MSDALRSMPEAANALPAGTRLGEFELRSLLGVGGFGIVYLAFDHQLEREVAIKEYMPASMAGRTETMQVSLRSQSDAEVFALGLRSFVNEARLLARFDHPSLLKVHRFWEANGTAYMAMPVLRGRTLKAIRQAAQTPDNPPESPIDERWLRRLLEPLLGALETLHAQGVYHRDIAPDNIEIEPDGHPVLLDFGAARRVIGDKTQTLTAILKPAYAPIEQYAEAGSVKQGPWTDIYALGATLHYMLLGHPPSPATARAVHDDEVPLAQQKIVGCSENFLHLVDWMLAPRPGDRPQNVAALREVLAGRVPPPQRRAADAIAAAQWQRTQVLPRPEAVSPQAPAPAPAAAADKELAARAMPPAAAAGAPARALPPIRAAAAAPAGAPAAAGKSKALPIALGAVAVVAAAAFALWPRMASQSAETPAMLSTTAAPGTSTNPAAGPAVAPAAAPTPRSTIEPAPAAATQADVPAVQDTSPAAKGPAPAAPHATSPSPTHGAAPARTPPKMPKSPPAADPPPANLPAAQPNVEPAAAAAQAPPSAAQPTAPVQAQAAPPPALAPSEPAKPQGPAARCSGRNALSHFVCMERECFRPAMASHPDCQEWRKAARPRD